MMDHDHVLSLSRQAKALGISRSSIYYQAQPVSDADLAVMRRIDELHLNYPFAGSRMLQGFLVREGFGIGRLHVRTLMKRMGIEAIYRRPNTSKPAPGGSCNNFDASILVRHKPASRISLSPLGEA